MRSTQRGVQDPFGQKCAVRRWLREDWAFQAAYNGFRRDLRHEIQARLDIVAHAAPETGAAAVDAGDVRAALAVLRGAGVLAGPSPPIGPDDLREVAEDAELEVQERASLRMMRRITQI